MTFFQALAVFLTRLAAGYTLLAAAFGLGVQCVEAVRVMSTCPLERAWGYIPHFIIVWLLFRYAVPIGRRLGAELEFSVGGEPKA